MHGQGQDGIDLKAHELTAKALAAKKRTGDCEGVMLCNDSNRGRAVDVL